MAGGHDAAASKTKINTPFLELSLIWVDLMSSSSGDMPSDVVLDKPDKLLGLLFDSIFFILVLQVRQPLRGLHANK